MFIECLIKRESKTTVTINGFRYEFEEANDGALVCNIMSPEHIGWFLRMPSFYRKYEPKYTRKTGIEVEDSLNTGEQLEDEAEEENDIPPEEGLPPPGPSFPSYYFESEEEAREFFSGLKINDLRKTAKEYGLTLPGNSKKEDLVEAVVKVAHDQK